MSDPVQTEVLAIGAMISLMITFNKWQKGNTLVKHLNEGLLPCEIEGSSVWDTHRRHSYPSELNLISQHTEKLSQIN